MPEIGYRIRNWDRYFEKAQSFKVRITSWVPVPNKHDGKTFRRIAQHPESVRLYCAWQLIVQVASKMPIRGVLVDEDGPVTVSDISAMTGFPDEIFSLAFSVLTTSDFKWLEQLTESMLGAYSQEIVSRLGIGNSTVSPLSCPVMSCSTSSSEEPLGKFEAAVKAFRSAHPQCKNVPTVPIVNTLQGWPEDRWLPAIETMGRHYAGAEMKKPIGHLENFLAGKPTYGGNGAHGKTPAFARKKAAEEELAKLRSTNYPSVEQSNKMRELKRVIAECNQELVKG